MTEHVLIVGASSPLAAAAVSGFLACGNRLTLVGRNDPVAALGDQGAAGDVAARALDLQDLDSIRDFVAGLCADRGAITRMCFFQRYRGGDDANAWEGEYAVSLRATSRFIEAFRAQPQDGNDRSVVIVSSPADSGVVLEQSASYHVGKAGLSQMVRYYAVALGPKRIRVNGVRPAIVLKPRARAFYDQNPDLVTLFERVTPLGRMGLPADIANATLFLSSAQAAFITGQVLAVDGGLSLHEAGSLSRLAASVFKPELADPRWDEEKEE